MGELKSCLFCGKRVDQAFEYCPHCGYEFGDEDEHVSAFGPDQLSFGLDRSIGDLPLGLSRTAGSDLPVLVEEESGECVPAPDEDYLHRLRTLQDMLADLERELDRLLAAEADGGVKGRA